MRVMKIILSMIHKAFLVCIIVYYLAPISTQVMTKRKAHTYKTWLLDSINSHVCM